ncbi:MAG: PucR family transcriptional regulator ligand-binding domain-containing protein [Tissierellaceae bacterium]|nr:PucR family transcriptional regulator ligand-binding domain-containing protein [Tissierellaceae bacterium]
MVTVEDILSIPALRKLSVIGGKDGLNKRVSYVTVMEVPDIVRWLKGNDFVITSFYACKDNIEEQVNLIDKLADNRCSCLAVKTGQYVKELDKSVIERANLRGLVLVKIPTDVTYIEIIVNATNKIFENRDIDFIIEKYMKDIIFNNINDNEMIFARGNLLGFNIRDTSSLVITLSMIDEVTDERINILRKTAKTIAKQSDTLLKFTYNPVVTVGDKSSILFFSSEAINIENNLSMIIELIHKNNNREILGDIHIGVGPIGLGLDGLKDSYFKSIEVLKIGSIINNKTSIYYYDNMNIYITLEKFLRTCGKDVFKEIYNQLDDDLILTLDSFYENNMDVNLTADDLFIHKNTVRYRLKKIKEITGYDTSVFEDNFKLYLFLIYTKITKNSW